MVSAFFKARNESRGYPTFTFEEELPSSFSVGDTVAFLGQWLAAQEAVWLAKPVPGLWGRK
jgi:hypothetical protein